MKLIRRIIAFLLGFILFNLIGFLVISFAFKDVMQNQIIGGIVKEELIPNALESANISESDREKINEVLNDNKTNEVINKLVDDVMYSIGSGEELKEETIDKLYEYIVENKEVIESVTNEKIDVNEIEKYKDTKEYKEFSNDLITKFNETTNDLGDFEKNIIKTYNYLTSNSFRTLLIIGIIVCILLLILVEWSIYKWLGVFGNSLIACGLFLIVLYIASLVLVNYITTSANIEIEINTILLLISGTIFFVVGIIIKRTYKRISRDKFVEETFA